MTLLEANPRTGERDQLVTPLPWPTNLPELAAGLRVRLLIDMDTISRGMASNPASGRASDWQVQRCLDIVQATARALDPYAQARYAASSKTAAHHLTVLTSSGNGIWSIRRGLGGADQVILEELNSLTEDRVLATRPHRPRPAHHANMIILVAADHAYAAAVRRLRLLGVPTWGIVPGRFVAASLHSSCCALSYLRADPAGPHTLNGRVARQPSHSSCRRPR